MPGGGGPGSIVNCLDEIDRSAFAAVFVGAFFAVFLTGAFFLTTAFRTDGFFFTIFFTADFFLTAFFAAVFLAGFREADFFAMLLLCTFFGMGNLLRIHSSPACLLRGQILFTRERRI
jgi:hypothetical protein